MTVNPDMKVAQAIPSSISSLTWVDSSNFMANPWFNSQEHTIKVLMGCNLEAVSRCILHSNNRTLQIPR